MAQSIASTSAPPPLSSGGAHGRSSFGRAARTTSGPRSRRTAVLALVLGVALWCETISAWDEILTSGATAEQSFEPLDNSQSSYVFLGSNQ